MCPFELLELLLLIMCCWVRLMSGSLRFPFLDDLSILESNGKMLLVLLNSYLLIAPLLMSREDETEEPVIFDRPTRV